MTDTEKLQEQLAYQERTIEQLNEALVKQQRQLTQLQEEMRVLTQLFQQLRQESDAGGEHSDQNSVVHEIPPHY